MAWKEFRWDIVLSSFLAIVIVYVLSFVVFLLAHVRSKNILGKTVVLSLASSLPSTILIGYSILSLYDSFSIANTVLRLYSVVVFALTMLSIVPFSILLLEIHVYIAQIRNNKLQSMHVTQFLFHALKSICSCIFSFPMIAIYVGMTVFIVRTSIPQDNDSELEFVVNLRTAFNNIWNIPALACDFVCFFSIGMFMPKQKIFSSNIIKPSIVLVFKLIICPLIAYGLAQGFGRLFLFTTPNPTIETTASIFACVILAGMPSSQINLFISAQYRLIGSYLGPIYIIGSFFAIALVYIAIPFTQLTADQLFNPLFIFTNSSMSYLLKIITLSTCTLTILGTTWTGFPILIHKKYRNSTRRLVSALCVLQFIRAAAIFSGNIAGFIANPRTLLFYNVGTCVVQGIIVQFSNSSLVVLYSCIAFHLLVRFGFQKKVRFYVELIYYCISIAYGIISVIPIFIGHFVDPKFGFGLTKNGWCWMTNVYFQVFLFYVPFLISAIVSAVCLFVIQVKLWRKPSGNTLKTNNNLRELLLAKSTLFIGLYIYFYVWGFTHSLQTWILSTSKQLDGSSIFIYLFLDSIFSCGQGVVTFFAFGTGTTLLEDYKQFIFNIVRWIRKKVSNNQVMKQGDKEESKMNEQITKTRWNFYNAQYRSNIFSFGNMLLMTTCQEEVDGLDHLKQSEGEEIEMQQVVKHRQMVKEDLKERLIMTAEPFIANEMHQIEKNHQE